VGNPYLFTGRRYIADAGIYYYRARYYHPELRRFLEPDPIGYADGMNLYTYAGNNPVMYVDPMGTCAAKAARGWSGRVFEGSRVGIGVGLSVSAMGE
jgi:RHS repeat-associated protein